MEAGKDAQPASEQGEANATARSCSALSGLAPTTKSDHSRCWQGHTAKGGTDTAPGERNVKGDNARASRPSDPTSGTRAGSSCADLNCWDTPEVPNTG